MAKLKDFIENNDNVKVVIHIIDSPNPDEYVTDYLLYDDYLHDIPEEMYELEVVSEGYGITTDKNYLKVYDADLFQKVEMRYILGRLG